MITVFVFLSYFIVAKPVGPSMGTAQGMTFSDEVTQDEVCAAARKEKAEAWVIGIAYENDGVVGTVIRKRIPCAYITHSAPEKK